jgi:Domain of unknown function (DUF4402)
MKQKWHITAALALWGGLASTAPISALAQGGAAAPLRPLQIDIIGDLDFGLAAQEGGFGGAIIVDPVTGARTLTGGLVSVSGSSFFGQARITGEPFAHVRIDLPSFASMNASHGGKAEITNLSADVPPVVVLDAGGVLDFHFAGRFSITRGEEGDFKGRVQITANYE